jgi:hypothetical protein
LGYVLGGFFSRPHLVTLPPRFPKPRRSHYDDWSPFSEQVFEGNFLGPHPLQGLGGLGEESIIHRKLDTVLFWVQNKLVT